MKNLLLVLVLSLTLTQCSAQQPVFNIVIRNHLFYPDNVYVPADTAFILKVTNEDASVEEFESLDLNIERIIGGRQSAQFFVRPLKTGRYLFYGEFHRQSASGFVVVE